MSTSTSERPILTGGCLCGSVRYSITIPADAEYPPERQTCQCSQCRKSTGSLVATVLWLRPSYVTWLANSTFKEFASSAEGRRGFCANCGSTLTWRSTNKELNFMDIFLGTLDEEVLRDNEVVARPDHELFFEHRVKGVTDRGIYGKRWKGRKGGEEWKEDREE